MADRKPPRFAVETLHRPERYSEHQITQARIIAGCCREAFASVRFVYALPPDE